VGEEVLTALSVAVETQDPILNKVYPWVQSGWPNQCDGPELEPYFSKRLEFSDSEVVLWGARVIILLLSLPRVKLPMLLYGRAEDDQVALPPVSYLSVSSHLKFHSTPSLYCR
jgi:hypothetical protein